VKSFIASACALGTSDIRFDISALSQCQNRHSFARHLSGLTIRVGTTTQRLESLRDCTRFQEHQLCRTPKTGDGTIERYNDLLRLRDERIIFPVVDSASPANVLEHIRQVPVRFSMFRSKLGICEDFGNVHMDRGVSEDGILIFGNADAQEDRGPLSGTTDGGRDSAKCAAESTEMYGAPRNSASNWDW